jgi:hypothetical protein
MELCIGLFEFNNGLLELDVMHEEVSLDVVEVRMEYCVGLDDIVDVLKGLVVFVLLLKDADH